MKVLKALATGIGSIAPTIATMLGGPLAGTAVKALTGALGLSDDAPPEEITKAVGNLTPDQIASIRAADQEHAEKMRQMDVDLDKLNKSHQESLINAENADRDSARQREVAVKDSTPSHLAYMIIGGFFIVATAQLVALMGWPGEVAKIPPQGWVLIGNISGYLAAEAKAAASYYFGSSTGSKIKDQTIANQASGKS